MGTLPFLKLRWTARKLETLGYGVVVLGLGLIYVPAGVLAAGLLLILAANVRVGNG